jgi:hypothetical protein
VRSVSIGRPESHDGRRGRVTDDLDAPHTTHIRCHMAIVQAVPSTSAACWNDELKACGRTDVSSQASHDGCDHVFLSILTPPSQAIKPTVFKSQCQTAAPFKSRFRARMWRRLVFRVCAHVCAQGTGWAVSRIEHGRHSIGIPPTTIRGVRV